MMEDNMYDDELHSKLTLLRASAALRQERTNNMTACLTVALSISAVIWGLVWWPLSLLF
jgi:hypothetical protein